MRDNCAYDTGSWEVVAALGKLAHDSLTLGPCSYDSDLETKLNVRVIVVGWPDIVIVVVEVVVEVSFCEGAAPKRAVVKASLSESVEVNVVLFADKLVCSISVVSSKAPVGIVML